MQNDQALPGPEERLVPILAAESAKPDSSVLHDGKSPVQPSRGVGRIVDATGEDMAPQESSPGLPATEEHDGRRIPTVLCPLEDRPWELKNCGQSRRA